VDGKTHFDPTDIGAWVWANPWGLTMTADGKRGCFVVDGPESTDQGRPSQIVIVDFEPSSFAGAPVVGDIKVTPRFMVNDKSNTLSLTCKTSIKAKEMTSFGVVLCRNGTRYADVNALFGMRDDAQRGDETADDGVFTNSEILPYTNSGNPIDPGPIVLRLHLMDKGWNLTVVDLEGIEVRAP
jgi:hypothetical protein